MSGVLHNVVLAEHSQSALSLALLTTVIGAYAWRRGAIKRWYYDRSIDRHKCVKKSYTVTWRILEGLATFNFALAAIAFAYIIAGLLTEDFRIYDISAFQFRIYTVAPFVLFWVCILLGFFLIHICAWLTKPDNDVRESEKLSEFDSALVHPSLEADRRGYRPGERSPSQGSYYAIDNRTKIPRAQMFMRGGDLFPTIGEHDVYYIRRGD
jgi:hypothetical protein